MTRLPGARVVELAKITGYLLNADHSIGRAKAVFFGALGFASSDPVAFGMALDRHGAMRPVVTSTQTEFGIKHEVRCTIASPDGRNPCIVTIWFQPTDSEVCRLVTAYPAR